MRASKSELNNSPAPTGDSGNKIPQSDIANDISSHSLTGKWTEDDKASLSDVHPIVKRNYIIPTPMLKKAYDVVRDRIFSRRTGVVFYGETRAGKTTCALRIREFLGQEFAHAYISMATCRRTSRVKDGHMSRLILEGVNHACAARTQPDLLLQNVITDIELYTKQKHGDQYVLLLDEINLLNEADLTSLLELHNILQLRGIRMTTISFGQPEILDLISALKAQNKMQIVARFFRSPQPFLCCDCEETLKDLLIYFDDHTDWPEGSGWSYTRFFFPRAFSAGFRLATYSSQIWAALCAAGGEHRTHFTMEMIALTIEWLILASRSSDGASFSFRKEDFFEAVESADVVW
ncbi:ATP-binding protein [Paraburkholderia strydomiana]|uniref:ATP-binding protein n=1 Tax=Paraburkholderia strydomiana TaxID=1245417 RepID=UPI0038B82410